MEINLFLESFFVNLQEFVVEIFNFYLILERQNKKTVILKKNIKSLLIKRKQNIIFLRKYNQFTFFNSGLNMLFSSLITKKSFILAKYIAIQLQFLKYHNFFIRFLKDILKIFIISKKLFFSKVLGIKIKIKGRFNNRPRAQNRLIKLLKVPPVTKKNVNINCSEDIALSISGHFGIKV